MLEGQVAFYLNKYLGSYVYGLDPQSLKISVFKGDVQLNNLHLKPEALNALNLPITVKAGLLGSLTLKVPWASLGRAPVLVELDRLYLLAGPKQEFEETDQAEDQDFDEAEQQAKRQRVADAELAATQGQGALSHEAEKDGGGRLKAIIDTVIGNLQTSITNVHIRYEDDTSNPGVPFACGLTLEKLSAHTVNEDGNQAFVKDNPLSLLRKASQLRRFAVYFDVGKPLWKPQKVWGDMLAYDWDQLFKSGIAASSQQQRGPQQDPSGASQRMYMIRPIDGQLHYLRRGKNVRQGESEAIQEAGFDLQSIAFSVSKPQYQSLQRLLDEFSAYAARAPNAHLRPKTRPQSGRSAAKWWRYVGTVVRSQQQQRLTWSNIELICQLRKQYITHYIKCLQENQMGGDEYTERMDAQLPEATILLFRRLAHAKVDREKKRAAAAAAREKREAASKGWFGWLRGGTSAQTEDNDEAAEEDPDMEGELTSADVRKLQSLVDEQEQAVQAGKETPDNLRIKINLSIGSTALVLLGSDNTTELLKAGLDGLKSVVHMYPETLEVLAAVQAVGASSPEGDLLTTGGATRQKALMRSISSKALQGNSEMIDSTSQALAVRYVQKPQDGHADTVAKLSFSPSFVTYNPVTIQNIQDFFKTGEAVDLSALGAQALAQVEKARKAVAEQLAAAMNQKPKLDLTLELDAPKIAIPVPATEDGKGKLTLVADLGQFALETDTAKANSLPLEEASLYECFKLGGSNISAYLVDGDFAFSALEGIDNRKAPTPETSSENATVSTAMTAAIQQSEGKAQGGSAVFIPLLERCGITAALQAARFPHPSLPPMRLQLQVPQLRFFFGPARLGRIMRAVDAITPAPEPETAAEEEQLPQWRISPDQTGPLRVLTWGGIARNTPQWPHRWGSLYRGSLYLLEHSDAAEPLETWNIWNGRRIVRVPADAVAGAQHVIGILPNDVDVHDAKDNADSLLLRLLDKSEADQWYRQLVRSHENMQQLVGGTQDPTSPLEADWDSSSFTTEQSGQVEPDTASWTAGKAPQAAVSLQLSASLGELAIFVSGRATEIWWPPEFTEDEDGEPVPAAAPGKDRVPYDQTIVNVDGEQSLIVLRASGGSTAVTTGPNSMSASVSIGSFEIEDLLVGSVCLEHSYLARSSLPAEERFHDASTDLQQPASPGAGSDAEEFKDAPGPDEIASLARASPQWATSGPDQSQALSLSYSKWAPQSPDYHDVDAEVQVQLKTLSFFCNRPTVAALMAIGNDISAVNAGQQPDAPAAALKQLPSQTDKTQVDQVDDADIEQGLQQASGNSNRVVLKVSLQLEKLEARLQYESSAAPPLGLLSVEAVAVDVTLRPDTLNATASLGNLKAQDGALPEGHPYRNVCDLRHGSSTSLISVQFASHTAEESHSNSRVPSGLPYSTLKARLSELDFIFLNRFAQEVLQYVSVLLVLQPAPIQNSAHNHGVPALATAGTAAKEPTPEAEKEAAKQTTAASTEGAQEVGMVLQMDIDMEAPVISMPRNSDSQDCVQLDLGSFSLHNSLKWIGGSSTSDPKAVLIEHDEVSITDLSAIVTSNGQRGDNLIKDYDKGMTITLRRPIYNPHLLVPNLDVAVDIPSIKMVLSDKEYQLISSMAGDNFAEPQKIPQAARWLQQYYTTPPEALAPADADEEEDTADSKTKPQTKQEMFKQAVRTGDKPPTESAPAEEEKTSMRVLLNMGKAEVELQQGSQDNPSNLKPLARFLVGGLWISYRMTHTGTMRLALSLPRVEAVDLRPWVPPEHALVVSSEHTNPDGSYRAAQQAKNVAWPPPSNSPAHLMKPSFLTVELCAQQSLSRQKIQMRLQRPTVVAEVGFMLSVAKFFIPGFAMSGLVPIPFESNDVVLTGLPHKADRDLWLSPESRLLADSPGTEDFIYDGQGRRLVLPQDISVEEPLPLILIGPGKTLQLKNIKLVHAASLPACLQLAAGAQLSAHPADNVEKIDGVDDSDPTQIATPSSVQASGQLPRAAASGAVSSVKPGTMRKGGSGASAQRPMAPDLVADATNAAVNAAAAAVDLSCMQLDVVAVGMSLRFVEIETSGQASDLDRRTSKGQEAEDKTHSVRMLAASLDLAASYKVEGDEQTAHAELRGLKLVTQINLGSSDSSSEEKSKDSNTVQGAVLEPCRVGVDMKMRNGTGDFNLSLSDLKLNLAPDILELVQSLQSSVLEPLVQPAADQPMAKCTRFSQVWSNRPTYRSSAEASCDAHVLGGERGVTIWRPQPPLGYAILGDCITAGSAQPAFQVLALAVNSGLVTFPTSYNQAWSDSGIYLWQPHSPEGYIALGCLATPTPDPPAQTAMVCVHQSLGVQAPLGQCLSVKPQQGSRRESGDVGHLSEGPAANVWCVDNAAATFVVCTAEGRAQPEGPLYDVRSPLGVTPAALKALRNAPQAVLQGLKPAKEQGYQAYQSFRKTRANLLKTQNKKRLKAVAVDFKRIWWDKGVRAGSREGAGIWRPVPPEGYFSLGDCLMQGFSPPESAIVIRDSQPAGLSDQTDNVALLRPPRGYELVFQDQNEREDKRLSLWKPLPLPGYVAVGYVANLGTRAPSRQVVRCVRADAVSAMPGYTSRPSWQLPPFRNRPALAVWASDDRLCTFVAGNPRMPPLAQDIYRLRLLDQEDEQSAQEQQQTDAQGSGMNMVLKAGSTSVLLRDALRRPLAELELGGVKAGLRSLPTGVTQAYIGFRSSIWSYNAGVTAWEPVMEPWDIILKMDSNPNPLAAYGVQPGSHISVKSTSEAVHLTLAYAAVSSFVAAIQEWQDLRGAEGDETFKRQLAAADASRLHTIVDNKLGVPAKMELDFGDHMQSTDIPARESVSVVQPLSQPPLRHSKSLQAAPEAQPAALLLVDIMTATGLPILAAPQPDSEGRSGDFEGAQRVVCSLEFQDTLNSATSGAWGVRTRAITANQDGALEWVERLILELHGPIGTAGTLKVQLSDTAANSSKDEQLATAEVKLDMRQWKDSQTYQAQIPLSTTQESGDAKLLLRYTLQQQQRQESKQQHTDAWLDTASTAGQRALQVGEDPKWVVIPSSGLQRAAANVGAGGMVKKNLPDKQHKRKAAAAVLPVRVGDEGMAVESSFKDGLKNEVLRSLCQLVNSSELALEVCVVETADAEWNMLPRQAQSISSDQVQMQHQQSLGRRSSGADVVEEQIFEHERFLPLVGWSSKNLLPTERNRYSRYEEGAQSTSAFPQIRLSDGWEWNSPWEVELSTCVDKEGWAYAPDWGAMDWPPQPGAQKKGVVDFTRRRRWLRRRRLDLTKPAQPQQQAQTPAAARMQQAASRRTTSIKSIATEAAKKEVQRTVLGVAQPGETLPIPYGWQKAGKQLAVRPILDARAADTHGWSVGASDGDHNIHLDAMEEGLTRLVAALPSTEAESKGKEAVPQGDDSLASKLAASPVWLSLTVDADTFPASGQQEYKPLMDWKVVAAAPLVLENQLPVSGTYMIWETPREAGSNLMLRQSGHINSGERVHIYSADMRRTVSLQFYPDGFELVEPQPVLISQGYSSSQAGVQGRQKLPEMFRVQKAGGDPQEIFLDREIDMEAWQMSDKQLDPGAAVARGSPLLVRMLVPLWLVNATSLPIAAIVVAIPAPPKPRDQAGESSVNEGMQSAADSVKLRVMETRPRDQARQNPPGCRQVGAGAVTMMAYPMQRMEAFKQQGDRPMQYFGLCLRIGESGWAPPLPLESSDNTQTEDLNTKPVLLRARIPEWGTVHEVVVRVDMAGSGFERTMVLRMEPHCVVSNRTGIPLQLMHYSPNSNVQSLGKKATGVQPARAQQSQRGPTAPQGVARQQQDSASFTDIPAGALGVPFHWSITSESRAVCLRFAPPTAGSGEGAPWSHPLEASFPIVADRHVAIPVQPPTPSQSAAPGEAQSGREAEQQSGERSVATLLTGTGPAWELHGPRVARRLRHSASSNARQGRAGPETMTEVEVVILRFSLNICNPGCLHLVLESVSPKPPYLLENRTGHPFQYRQAGIGDLPFQPLPAYSAAGFTWQITEKASPREVEVQAAYGKQPPQRYPLDPPDAKAVTEADSSTHNRGLGGPLPLLPLSVQPGECLVQIVDREQELMSTAGLQTIGGGGGLGRGGLDRELRIVPSRKGPRGEVAVLGLASADDMSGRALYIAVSFGVLDISCVDHLPDELVAITIQGLSFSGALGIGPEGTFQRMQLSVQSMQIDDQLPASRFPVVLSPVDAPDGAAEVHPLIALTVISQPGRARGQTYYPLISFQISKPLQVSLSETLVWRAAEMVQRLDLASLSSSEDEAHAETATDVPMQMSLVSISNLSAKVSFRGDLAARPRWAGRTLSWALDMANFENVPVQITGFEMENSTMLWSVFIGQVGRNIKGQLMGVALSFLRNFGILSGASGVLGALSSGVASAALDDRFAVQRAQQKQERNIEGVGDGVVEGGAALGMGFYRGFTGLVSKPIEGAKSKGVGGFLKGVGKGVIGAVAQPTSGVLDFASSAFEGIDATKDQLIGRPRAGTVNKRLRMPRAIGGDGKVTAFIGSDGTEKEARVEEVGQALLRRTQDVAGLGPRRKGKRNQHHTDAYEEHMLLPEDQVVVLTNRCIMKLRAPGFAQVHRAAEQGAVSTSLGDLPPAEVRWAIPWQDLLTLELRWSSRDGPYPDRLTVHRKGRPGLQEEEPLAHELRCWPNIPQADQIHLIALKVQRKYWTEPHKDTQRWMSRHDELEQGAQGLPKQELPATMLSMDFKRVWITDRRNIQQCVSFWQPVSPPGYLPLGHVPYIGLDPPADPVLVYRDDSRKGKKPSVKHAKEFHLIWRQNGQSPVSMWEPLPPSGYRALGTIVVPAAEQPGTNEVLCVREDLCAQSRLFDSAIWKFEPQIMQAGLNVQRMKNYYPETWRCSCWQIDNPAGTFLANRSLSKPAQQAAVTASGLPSK